MASSPSKSSTLLGNHPRIKELKAQIADLDLQIRREGEKLARAFENDARVGGERVDALNASLDQLKRQATVTGGQDVEMRALEREAKAQRDLLESYLAKYRETNARDSLTLTPTEARIISTAIVSNTPAFPKKVPIVLIATLATFLVSVGAITTGELLAGNVYRPAYIADDSLTLVPTATPVAIVAPPPGPPVAAYGPDPEPAVAATAASPDPRAAARKAIAELVAELRAKTNRQVVAAGGPSATA